MSLNRPTFRQRVTLLRWSLPLILGLLAVFYELGPGRWIHDAFSASAYFDVDVVFYALVAPVLIFGALTYLSRWFDEKERAEKQARASSQRLASIMTASADAILALDAAGKIEAWNRGAELLFGYSTAQIHGHTLADLFGSSEASGVEVRWLTEAVRATGFVRGHETTCRDARGQVIAVELTATHLVDEGGQTLGMSVILRDVTERKHREAEIRQLNASLNEQVIERTRELAEKVEQLARANAELQKLDQMRTEFVSVVSHQIRAPLTNVRGAIERMETNCQVINSTCSRMFTIVDQQVGRLDRLVQDVLNAARIESGGLVLQSEPISLLPVTQQVVEQYRTGRTDRSFQVSTKPGLPLVFADRDRVAEVLANLLDNADKYSPSGKAVVVDLRADQTEVTISVQDSGRGIAAGDLDRVFDKFYRTDSSDSQPAYGYGLGLYVCRRLIEAQGGHIWAENRPGGGAIFSFALPVAR